MRNFVFRFFSKMPYWRTFCFITFLLSDRKLICIDITTFQIIFSMLIFATIFLFLDIGLYMNIALRRFLHNHGNITTEGSSKPGLCPTLISNDFKGSLWCQCHRQHYTLHAFEQFGTLYMHNHDDKYPAEWAIRAGLI